MGAVDIEKHESNNRKYEGASSDLEQFDSMETDKDGNTGSELDGIAVKFDRINEIKEHKNDEDKLEINGSRKRTTKLHLYSKNNDKLLEKCNGKAGEETAEMELQPMIMKEDDDHGDKSDSHLDKQDDATTLDHIPIDSGWAWMVLLGAILEMTIIIGILKTSGIFFYNFQKRFNSTSSMTSLISTVQNGVYSVAALMVMTVGMKFLSGRTFNMIGGTLLCICYIISSRAEDIRMLLFSHGILQGLGIACMQPIALSMIGCYFEKRRGFSNSLAVSGGSLGGLIFAPLLTTLFENYGYAGAMLITSSFFLHGWVTGALFRPLTFYTKKKQKAEASDDNLQTHTEIESITETSTKNMKLQLNGSAGRQRVLIRQDTVDVPDSPHSPFSVISVKEVRDPNSRRRAETFSEGDTHKLNIGSVAVRRLKSQVEGSHTGSSISLVHVIDKITASRAVKYASSEYMAGSLIDIPISTDKESPVGLVPDNISKQRVSVLKTVVKLFDFSLFLNPVFVGYILAAGLLCASNALSTVYIAPHAKENGISASGVAKLLTIYSAIDLCSRIIVGLIADRGWVRRSTIIGISACIIGISSNLLRFYTSYQWFIFYAVILGLFSGVHFSLFAVVIVDYLTLAKLQSCLGFTTLFHGASVSISFALIGILRDNSGSYLVPFHLLGTMGLVGGCLMTCLPVIERVYNRNKHSLGDP